MPLPSNVIDASERFGARRAAAAQHRIDNPPPAISFKAQECCLSLEAALEAVRSGAIKAEGVFIGFTEDGRARKRYPFFMANMSNLEMRGLLMGYVVAQAPTAPGGRS